MDIKTKFNVEDTVFIMEDNRIEQCKVTEVKVTINKSVGVNICYVMEKQYSRMEVSRHEGFCHATKLELARLKAKFGEA